MRWLGRAAAVLLITGFLAVWQLTGGAEPAIAAVSGGYSPSNGVILDRVTVTPPFDEVDVRLLTVRYLEQRGIKLAGKNDRGALILNLAVSGENRKIYHWRWLFLWPFHGLATDHVTLGAAFTLIDPEENRVLATRTVRVEADESVLFSDFRPVEGLYHAALLEVLASGAAELATTGENRR